jgi:hypothetical protein
MKLHLHNEALIPIEEDYKLGLQIYKTGSYI